MCPSQPWQPLLRAACVSFQGFGICHSTYFSVIHILCTLVRRYILWLLRGFCPVSLSLMTPHSLADAQIESFLQPLIEGILVYHIALLPGVPSATVAGRALGTHLPRTHSPSSLFVDIQALREPPHLQPPLTTFMNSHCLVHSRHLDTLAHMESPSTSPSTPVQHRIQRTGGNWKLESAGLGTVLPGSGLSFWSLAFCLQNKTPHLSCLLLGD